jgi:hypothetical protein
VRLASIAICVVLSFGATSAGANVHSTAVSGEVFRLDLDGRLVNLSRSRFQDTGPVLSPNGRRVAFFSDRPDPANGLGVFVASVSGGGLAQVAPTLRFQDTGPLLQWGPDSRTLAISGVPERPGADWSVFLAEPGRPVRRLASKALADLPSWSPDGRLLTFQVGFDTVAVDNAGRRAWHVFGKGGKWSAAGRLATGGGLIRIYNLNGQLTAKPFRGLAFAWSPRGTRLAVIRRKSVELHTPDAKLIKRLPLRGETASVLSDVVWIGEDRVAVRGLNGPGGTEDGSTVIDTRSGRHSRSPFDLPYIAHTKDWAEVADTTQLGKHFVVEIADIHGTHRRPIAQIGRCQNGGVYGPLGSVPAFTPDARSLIYWRYCP